jgi:hypothetical protein
LHRQREWRWAVLFALLRMGLCGYRAATQSIVHDEAFSFFRFLNGPWSDLWSPLYDASNHVLYMVLAKCSVALFGVSEFALRAPSVLAGFAMMLGIFRVLEACERPWVRWMSYLALGLHPLLLDFSVAARWYGLGLACLAWAIHALQQDRLRTGGVLLGLGIAANLTIAIPAVALGIALGRRALQVWVPAAGVALAICAYPMRGAGVGHFYVGLPTLDRSLVDFIYTSTRVVGRSAGLFGTEDAARWIAHGVVPLWLLSVAVVWRARPLVPVALALSIVGVVAAHVVLGVQYPVDRTGLYLVVLTGLSWAMLADSASQRWMRIAQAALAMAFLLQFATQLQAYTFRVWPFNAAAKQIALQLRQECQGKAPLSVAVSTYFADQPGMEFYRRQYRLDCLRPMERLGDPNVPGYDYYVTNPEQPGPSREVLYADPISGSGLAR